MIVIWKEADKKIKSSYHYFLNDFDERPKKYFRCGFFVLLASLIVTVIMFVFPSKIRQAQIDSVVYATISSSKLRPLNINEASETIKESAAISVLFSVPKGEMYQELIKVFHYSKKMQELNRPIYFYPLVYDVDELEEKYHLNQNQMTIIFFKNGKEANRLTIGKKERSYFSNELIPELNRLPLTKLKKLEDKLMQEETGKSK
ncbi:hypothetical protein AALA44_00345 [Enterococcus ratti]|uniref:hypothetical protein n=1 Tax=Enterococcus ratti TaxID=150033 RepID=UPI003514C499